VLFATLGVGAIGWVDDYRKVVHRNPKGLSAKAKMFWHRWSRWRSASTCGDGDVAGADRTDRAIPQVPGVPLGALAFLVLVYLVIVGSSNAVNLTDGLDGLAILPTVMVSGALAIFAYVAGHAVFSKYLGVPYIPGAGELAVFCLAISGAGLAFLWFNAYPAEVFMGDVGALALGAALAPSRDHRQELVLFIMGGVFVVEAVSVMLQVSWFKYTKKKYGTGQRILLMAPLHHHFEQKGWKETQVVVRFWIITMLLVLIGLATLKLR